MHTADIFIFTIFCQISSCKFLRMQWNGWIQQIDTCYFIETAASFEPKKESRKAKVQQSTDSWLVCLTNIFDKHTHGVQVQIGQIGTFVCFSLKIRPSFHWFPQTFLGSSLVVALRSWWIDLERKSSCSTQRGFGLCCSTSVWSPRCLLGCWWWRHNSWNWKHHLKRQPKKSRNAHGDNDWWWILCLPGLPFQNHEGRWHFLEKGISLILEGLHFHFYEENLILEQGYGHFWNNWLAIHRMYVIYSQNSQHDIYSHMISYSLWWQKTSKIPSTISHLLTGIRLLHCHKCSLSNRHQIHQPYNNKQRRWHRSNSMKLRSERRWLATPKFGGDL